MIYQFTVPAKIVGKERPRMNTYTGRAYTPTKTKDYEELIKQYFVIKYPRYVEFENRVSIHIKAYFKIPASVKKEDKEKMLQNIISPTKKPDIDNITKSVLDALNKMAFKDDNQVTKIVVEKVYTAEEEKIEIEIEEY